MFQRLEENLSIMWRTSLVSRIAHAPPEEVSSGAADAPWWDRLDREFSRRPLAFPLGRARDRVYVGVSATLDRVLRTLGATAVGTTALPLGYHPWRLRETLEAAEFYERVAVRGDADVMFARPREHVVVRTRAPWRPTFVPEDGVVEDVSFESPFRPVYPAVRRAYLRHRANRRAHARFWRHLEGPRPTIIAVHGFCADPYWLNEWFFSLPWLYRLGCDVLLFTLPFHGRRQGRLSPFSGHGFFAGGAARTNEAFAQAVCDIRVLIDYLQRRWQAPRIGVTGVSLGGLTTALVASVEPRVHVAIPNVPVVSLADLVLEWEPIGIVVRTLLRGLGLDVRQLRRLFSVITPLSYAPRLPHERLMIIGGVGDRLAPPKHALLLWEHWQRCALHWFPGSHVVHLDKGRYLQAMLTFLSEVDFLDDRLATSGFVPAMPELSRLHALGRIGLA